MILDGSLFYVTVPFSFLLVYGTSKKKVVFFPLKSKAYRLVWADAISRVFARKMNFAAAMV